MKTFLFVAGCALLAAKASSPPAPKSEPPGKAVPPATRKSLRQGATATLLGKEITAKAGDELTGRIVGALFKRYATENKIRPTDAEIRAFNETNERGENEQFEEWKRDQKTLEKELTSPRLSAAERKEKEEKLAMSTRFIATHREMEAFKKANPNADRKMNREIAEQFILSWKINQSLFRRYGGRVIFQQAGPEPVDAYRDFLKEREKKGDFRLLTDEAREKFWKYFTNDRMHTFLDEVAGREAMTTPWWLKATNEECLSFRDRALLKHRAPVRPVSGYC